MHNATNVSMLEGIAIGEEVRDHKKVSLNLSHFVAQKIWRRRGVSPLRGRAHRLQRHEPL
jgi:hypothetical protein